MEREKQYRCLSKAELAEQCGVCRFTLHNWLNNRYYAELQKLGYKKRQKILLPPQVKFLVETLVIVIE